MKRDYANNYIINGLWSVQYEGVPGHFRKVKMVCPCIKDGCDQDCEVF